MYKWYEFTYKWQILFKPFKVFLSKRMALINYLLINRTYRFTKNIHFASEMIEEVLIEPVNFFCLS
ncbi:hypothetical protein D9O36_02815 [Zobellia amurskyensis]|uniref:Uncharacterized protein n=1 Tax=Zobellia amurskyensis TaxID=248905 RepID=A0A7X2ZQX6_9FLAO|nr:hypothetical protein [Zobellia amurskyensis]